MSTPKAIKNRAFELRDLVRRCQFRKAIDLLKAETSGSCRKLAEEEVWLGGSALHVLASSFCVYLKGAPKEEKLELLDTLIQLYPEGVMKKDQDGKLPIHHAATTTAGDSGLEVAQALIGFHPECLQSKDKGGNLPIHIGAAKARCNEMVGLLHKEYPLGVKETNKEGNLPIHIAASKSSKMAEFLYQLDPLGAGKKNNDGDLPIHIAARGCFIVTSADSSNLVKFLVRKHRLGLRNKNNKGELPIHIAAFEHKMEKVKFLHAKYPRGIQERDNFGNLPIHKAAESCRSLTTEVLEFLISEHPSGVKQPNDEGNLPIHKAVMRGNITEAQFLIQKFPQGLLHKNKNAELPIDCVPSSNDDLFFCLAERLIVDCKTTSPLEAYSKRRNVRSWLIRQSLMLPRPSENEAITTENRKVQQPLQECKQQLQDSTGEKNQLLDQLDQQKQSNEQLGQSLKDERGNSKQLEQYVREEKQSAIRLRDEKQKLAESLASELEKYKTERTNLISERKDLCQRVNELELNLKKYKEMSTQGRRLEKVLLENIYSPGNETSMNELRSLAWQLKARLDLLTTESKKKLSVVQMMFFSSIASPFLPREILIEIIKQLDDEIVLIEDGKAGDYSGSDVPTGETGTPSPTEENPGSSGSNRPAKRPKVSLP